MKPFFRLLSFMLSLTLLFSALFAPTAVGLARAYSIKYSPGCSDQVTNMPEETMNAVGEVATVSNQIPIREGYEFSGWKLNFAQKQSTEYTVKYVDSDGNVLLPEKVFSGQVGENVTVDVYSLFHVLDSDSNVWHYRTRMSNQTLTLSDNSGDNILTYVYERVYKVTYEKNAPEWLSSFDVVFAMPSIADEYYAAGETVLYSTEYPSITLTPEFLATYPYNNDDDVSYNDLQFLHYRNGVVETGFSSDMGVSVLFAGWRLSTESWDSWSQSQEVSFVMPNNDVIVRPLFAGYAT